MNKRATFVDMIFSPLFETILALGVVLTYLLWFISSFASDVNFEKGFMATDIALSVDLMMLFPGNIDILYSPHISNYNNFFSFNFLKDKVEVFQDNNDKNKGIYYFSLKRNIGFKEKRLDFNSTDVTIRLSKVGNDFFVSDIDKELISFDSHQISCPSAKVNIPNRVIIDAGHGFNPTSTFSDTGFVVNNTKESEFNRQIAFSFFNTAKNFFNVELTRELEQSQTNPDIENSVSEQDRLNKINSIDGFFLSFHLGNYNNKNFIKAFVALNKDFDKSFKLACEIVNSISLNLVKNNISVDGTAIIPVDVGLNKNNHLNILSANKVGALIELGSINNPIINNENNVIISQSIIDGVQNAK